MMIYERTIRKDGEDIGNVCLLMYPNLSVPFLQYAVMPPYQNQGIASREVASFLKDCYKHGHNRISAMVQHGNIPSIKIIEKNNFVKIKNFENVFTYLIDLRISKEKLQAFMDKFKTSSKHFGV
jgi:RimJ/RimL family protein N-acetyltransferase